MCVILYLFICLYKVNFGELCAVFLERQLRYNSAITCKVHNYTETVFSGFTGPFARKATHTNLQITWPSFMNSQATPFK